MPEIIDLHEPFERELRKMKICFIRARSDVQSTIAEGHPDFTLLRGNRVLMIEFKTEKGELSPKQKERIQELRDCGNTVFVVRDFERAMMLVREWDSQIGTTIMIPPGAPRQGLVLIGNGVYRKGDNGQYSRVRAATDDDRAQLRGIERGD